LAGKEARETRHTGTGKEARETRLAETGVGIGMGIGRID
jgi:hypothetical protein